MALFDTHAHYDAGGFDADRDEVLSALPAAGVALVVNTGCDVESSRAAVALADRLGLAPVVTHESGARTVASPVVLGDTPVSYRLPPPRLGEHDAELRAWLAVPPE